MAYSVTSLIFLLVQLYKALTIDLNPQTKIMLCLDLNNVLTTPLNVGHNTNSILLKRYPKITTIHAHAPFLGSSEIKIKYLDKVVCPLDYLCLVRQCFEGSEWSLHK